MAETDRLVSSHCLRIQLQFSWQGSVIGVGIVTNAGRRLLLVLTGTAPVAAA
jgi:hypothetical protein